MRPGSFFAALLISAAIAAAARPAGAQVDWHVAGVELEGSGCPPDSFDFVAFGNDASVLFRAFEVSLQGQGDGLTASKRCSVSIPATLKKGFRATAVSETLTYGVVKSDRSSGRIGLFSTLFGAPVDGFFVKIPSGALIEPGLTSTRTTLVHAGSCNGSSVSGLYESDLEVTARRLDKSAFIVLTMQGLDIHYDLELDVERCPRR